MLSRVINSTEHDLLLVGVSSHIQVRTVGIAFRTAAACQKYERRPIEHVGVRWTPNVRQSEPRLKV